MNDPSVQLGATGFPATQGMLDLTTPSSAETITSSNAITDSTKWQESLRKFYSRVSATRKVKRTRYYYQRIMHRLATIVEPNSRVLDIGCGHGDMLASLKPAIGVGIDLNKHVIKQASSRYPDLKFIEMRGEDVSQLQEKFDYIILSQTLGEIYDLQVLFRSIQSVCHSRTRLIVVHHSRVWQPALKFMEWLRIKRLSPAEQNWLPSDEIIHLMNLSGFETIRKFGMTLAPINIPLISGFINRVVANLPYLHNLGLHCVTIARSQDPTVINHDRPESVSIVIPACNEAGHIKPILDRIPILSSKQEIIFVEGGSKDHTWDTIKQTAQEYHGPFKVMYMQQDGKGKGDAVRKGFDAATGDVLMILDADISVPPEELSTFYNTLVSGQGEFINGSRMVYLMDAKAMRFLNLLGNKVFGWIFTYLLSQRFRDTLCGTKVLTRSDYQRVKEGRAYFGDFDPFGDFDLLFGASKLNLKIVDIPVHYKSRTYGDTNISRFRHGWILLKMCLFASRKIKFI